VQPTGDLGVAQVRAHRREDLGLAVGDLDGVDAGHRPIMAEAPRERSGPAGESAFAAKPLSCKQLA
jgi:hypothetical protein